MKSTQELAADFLAITTNLDSMPPGVAVTLYPKTSKDEQGNDIVVGCCARFGMQRGNCVDTYQTIEADTAAECLLKLARLLP
jgi:hypothetical protein